MAASKPFDPAIASEVLALQQAPPLREIEIGGRSYPLGRLGARQFADAEAHGARVAECGRTGKTPHDQDHDPSRYLQHLLYAGDADFRWATVRQFVTAAHCALGAQEFMRQVVVCALLPEQLGGQS
jgi:hypothetical protein